MAIAKGGRNGAGSGNKAGGGTKSVGVAFQHRVNLGGTGGLPSKVHKGVSGPKRASFAPLRDVKPQ